MAPLVGIDLSTTYCVVNIFRDDRIEILEDENVRHTLYTNLGFSQHDRTENIHRVAEPTVILDAGNQKIIEANPAAVALLDAAVALLDAAAALLDAAITRLDAAVGRTFGDMFAATNRPQVLGLLS